MLEEVARLNTSGNGNISDNVRLAAARYSCGATVSEVKRLRQFEAFHTPTVSNGSLSRLLFVTPQRCSHKSTLTFRQPLEADSPFSVNLSTR
jgi:hypothetical protein